MLLTCFGLGSLGAAHVADGVSLASWLDLMKEHPELLAYTSEEDGQTLLMSACLHVSTSMTATERAWCH